MKNTRRRVLSTAQGVSLSLTLSLIAAPAMAAPHTSGFRMADPEYFRKPHAPQKRPVESRIGLLAHPTTGAPALVTAGGTVTLRVGLPLSAPGRGVTVSLTATLANRSLSVRLPILSVRRVQGGRMSRVLCRVPATSPRAVYDVTLVIPGQTAEQQRRAVRVRHRADGALRVALVADHQLWDPSVSLGSGHKSAYTYPKRGEKREHRAMARQGLHELRLLDPDVILHLGDLVFGLDYLKEYRDALQLWSGAGLAAHMVPGNHDGYARYGVNLKAGLPQVAAGVVRCRKHFPKSLQNWAQIWPFLVCVYGDLKEVLFSRLLEDGLVTWRRTLGPTHYAFTVGKFRFIGLNTYDGTPQRRHAFSIWVNVKGLHLGAPMVDNYGGYLSVKQLGWLRGELQDAAAHKLTPVVFGHHDPRGNPKGTPYHANQSFPTDPVGPNHFEAWNFDSAWDSNPADSRGKEPATRHSGHALLRLLAHHGGYYLSGHVHRDVQRHYRKGDAVAPGIVARRPVTFIKVTTASASTTAGGYWGYRLVQARPNGTLDTSPFAAGLSSVPSGNLWAERHAAPGPPGGRIFTFHSGLPRPVKLQVQVALPLRPAGWRFSSPDPGVTVALQAVTPLPRRSGHKPEALYRLRVALPAGSKTVARIPRDVSQTYVYARPVPKNRPPQAHLKINGNPVKGGATVKLPKGTQLHLDATPSRDPEGGRLLAPLWEIDNGRGGHGPKLTLPLDKDARHTLKLTVRDAHGASASTQVTLVVGNPSNHRGPPPDGRHKSGCASCSAPGDATGALSLLLLALGTLLILLGGRRHKHKHKRTNKRKRINRRKHQRWRFLKSMTRRRSLVRRRCRSLFRTTNSVSEKIMPATELSGCGGGARPAGACSPPASGRRSRVRWPKGCSRLRRHRWGRVPAHRPSESW
jgi:hypothetical protein